MFWIIFNPFIATIIISPDEDEARLLCLRSLILS